MKNSICCFVLTLISCIICAAIGICIGVTSEKQKPIKLNIGYDYNSNIHYEFKNDTVIYTPCSTRVISITKNY